MLKMRKEHMKKAWLALTIAVLSIFVYGCTGAGNQSSGASPFIGGNRGLDISFAQGSPPVDAFDGGQSPFDVVVQLNNVGEYDIIQSDTQIKLSGLSPQDFGVSPNDLVKQADDFMDKTKKDPSGTNILGGGLTSVTFSNLKYLPQLNGPTTFPVRVDVCYKYGTNAQSSLCVKENPLDTRSNAVCEVNENKPVDNSGAPIAISSLTEFGKSRTSIGFTFTISQQGSGSIYRRQTKCNAQSTSLVNENKVFVTVNTRMPGLKCSGLQEGTDNSGYTTLYGGTQGSGGLSRTISCTQPLPAGATSYIQNVNINVEYDYKEFISTEMTIKHG